MKSICNEKMTMGIKKIHIITFGYNFRLLCSNIETILIANTQTDRVFVFSTFIDVFLLTYCVFCVCINFDIYHYSESLIYKMSFITLKLQFDLPTARSISVFLLMSIHSFSNIFMQTKTIRRTMSLVYIDISQEKNETGFSIGRLPKPEITQCFRSDSKKHMSNKWTWKTFQHFTSLSCKPWSV